MFNKKTAQEFINDLMFAQGRLETAWVAVKKWRPAVATGNLSGFIPEICRFSAAEEGSRHYSSVPERESPHLASRPAYGKGEAAYLQSR
ncbi:MAG: hypothetical protein A2927_00535 [Candidatus Komeilibacteria bacterium RIFCSPLOWO2_01_FULL_45_10]|uniref:Uncharacterized protein n=1 Tax=Candidatus Komeilibacteria bacterium RIFCSPLOWO2_01_FULL_45_10 TaxID=1798550 RepID=A0A1G2BIX1_9BACT|nr:MAG: hypothetical protein A2927_00535 [Candidatus Komeilibacteria bacterium RIFCSPLOWO2_01_FULL_45_10]